MPVKPNSRILQVSQLFHRLKVNLLKLFVRGYIPDNSSKGDSLAIKLGEERYETSNSSAGAMPGLIQFIAKPEKIVETILYLAHKSEFTRYQIVKFFYLADREHLRRFGRPITFDHYVAMKNGPVASIAYDIIKGSQPYGIASSGLPFDLIELGPYFGVGNPKREVNYDLFSKSDLKVLDDIVREFGASTFDELWEHTHTHEAYDKVWRNKKSLADPMAFDDFFEGMDDKDEIIDDLAFTAQGM